MYLIDTM